MKFTPLACLAVMLLAFSAPAQIVTLTNLPASVNTNSTAVTNCPIPITKGWGLALQGSFNYNVAGATNVAFRLTASADGTNYSTSPWATITAAGLGGGTVVWVTNWTAAQLAGLQALNLVAITNAHTAATLTNLVLLYSVGP